MTKIADIEGMDKFFEKMDRESKMKKEKEMSFEELMAKADEFYIKEEYKIAAGLTMDAYVVAINKEQEVKSGRKAVWAYRFAGFKSDPVKEADKKKRYYQLAKIFGNIVLKLEPDNLDDVISVIKGLMLLPTNTKKTLDIEMEGIAFTLNQEIVDLYLIGEREIKKRVEDDEEKNHLLAILLNSIGMVVRGYDIETAARIFEYGYLKVRLGTTEAGHLYHNKGTCYLMLKDETENKLKKRIYAKIALIYLEWALEQYPESAKDIATVEKKIRNTQEEIKNNFE